MELEPDDPRNAVYVDLVDMTITLLSGDQLPIISMINDEGGLCSDPDEAAWVTAGDAEQGIWTVPLEWADAALN